MTSSDPKEAVAKTIKQAQNTSSQIQPITTQFPDFDLNDAYEIAKLIHQMRLEEGYKPVGRKIGFTNTNMWAEYGVGAPIWSYMYDKTTTYLSDTNQACHIQSYTEPKIEPEIVLHFAETPPENATINELLACIDWIANGFEIVQSHFPNWQFKAADTVVDSGLHAELIIAEPRYVNQLGDHVLRDLETFEISLYCDDELKDKGCGANALGNPIKAALHLISVLSQQPDSEPLQAGELVTTGTLTAALPIVSGQTWHIEVSGIAKPL